MRTARNALFKLLQWTAEMEINDLMGQLAACLQHRLTFRGGGGLLARVIF